MSEHESDFGVDEWDRLILSSPELGLQRATAALVDDADVSASALLRYAAGRAQFEMGRIDEASVTLRDAVAVIAGRAPIPPPDDSDIEIRILMSAAAVLAEAGDITGALDTLDAVAERSDGVALGRVFVQRGIVLHHAGRLVEAIAALDRSDRLFVDGADDRDRWRMHQNRGVVLLQQGELAGAEADFLAAADIARALGMTAGEGQCYANLGALHGRARRLVAALSAFERADELLAAAGRPDRISTWLEIDRAEVMMHSGLLDEAVTAAHRALATARPSGNATLIGDALLMCARTELRAGRFRHAQRTAAAASEQLLASGREDMARHVEGLAASAELGMVGASGSADVFSRTAQLVADLRRLGWQEQADALSIERVRAAWRLGSWQPVTEDVAALRLHAFSERRDLALAGWLAEAVARGREGDRSASADACRRGLEFLDEITAEAHDLEARSAALRLGSDLSRWLIEVAVGEHDADLVLAASEGTRARALADELATEDRHRPLTEDGARRLLAELRGRLPGRTLVQWVVAGGRVWAVVCSDDGNRLVDVADLRSVVRERDRLVVWLDRAAADPDGSSSGALRAAGLLDELLLAPLELADDDAVVVVPVDELHGVPWSGLPSIAHRSVVISPSCRLWLDADRRSSVPVRTAGYVAGPNLTEQDTERASLRRSYARVDEATGAGATAVTVRTMFGAHDLVHVAAHGRFRNERPLLSTFELAEGQMTLHESVPDRVGSRLVVLSACEGGAHQGADGSEVLGLAAVLLARGAASVLAPLTVVRELECGEFVAAVHDAMAAGTGFGTAAAEVRSRWLGDDDLSRWAVASSFCCFGSDATRRAAP